MISFATALAIIAATSNAAKMNGYQKQIQNLKEKFGTLEDSVNTLEESMALQADEDEDDDVLRQRVDNLEKSIEHLFYSEE